MTPVNAVNPDAPAVSDREPNSHFLPEDKNYRLTGELPEELEVGGTQRVDSDEYVPAALKEEKKPDSAVTEEAPAASKADTAADPAPAQAQESTQKTPATSESRWAKITRENKELRDRLARLEGAQSAQSRDTSQASPPAADAKPVNPAEATEPTAYDKNSDGSWKYKSMAELNAAQTKYTVDAAVAKLKADTEKTQREQRQAETEQIIREGFNKKIEPTLAKYQDFKEVAFNPDLLLPKGSVADAFILESDHAGEILYYLGQHPEITQGFYGDYDLKTGKFVNKLPPLRQVRKLMEIEAEVSKPAPAPKITQAPRPPHQLDGKGTVAKDAVAQAVEDGDTEAYIAAQNAKELARRRKK